MLTLLIHIDNILCISISFSCSSQKADLANEVYILALANLRQKLHYTVNIYRYKTIETNGNTSVIPITSKSFSLYRKFLQPLQVCYHFLLNHPQRLKQFPVQAKGLAGSWNDTDISISLYSFVPINIYSVGLLKIEYKNLGKTKQCG